MKTVEQTQRGVTKFGEARLCGIAYRVQFHEGLATFIERDGMTCTRITVHKCDPHGLLYVTVGGYNGRAPFCHVAAAVEIAEELLGPNHYTSLAAMHRCERNIALRNIVRLPIFGPTRRLFWTHELPFRLRSIWYAVRHQFRMLRPERLTRVEWEPTA